MISINTNVDFFILSDGSLMFRKINFNDQSVELIEIGGEDAADLARILPFIWRYGITISRFVDFFEGRYSKEQIKETVSNLFSCGIFSNEFIPGEAFLEPFMLHQVRKGLFLVRIDCNVSLLRTESTERASIFAERILRRWGTEDNLRLVREAIKHRLQFFPAKCLSHEIIFSMADSLDFLPGRIMLEAQICRTGGKFVFDPFDSYLDATISVSERDGYWVEFIGRTLDSSLISNIREVEDKGRLFQLEKYLFVSSHILPNIEGKAIHDFQVGLGDSRGEACGKALMESLERYCCEKRPNDLFYARAVDFPDAFIDPNQLARYLDYQLIYSQDLKNFSVEQELFWTEMSDIEGHSYLIPAPHVWYCFSQSDFSDGRSLFWASTNGASAHFSYEKAVLSAVQELVERDAIMIWWLNRLSPPIINREALGFKLNSIIQKIEDQGFELQVLDLTLDLLPVCMIVVRKRLRESPYFFCGAACNNDFLVACEKALAETEHAIWDRSGGNILKINSKDLYYSIDHELFYLAPENSRHLDFLFSGQASHEIPIAEISQSVSGINDYLNDKGFRLFLKDITCPEIRELGVDVRVVKAVIPGLIPITFGYLSEPLALPRVYSLPFALGLREESITEEEILRNYQPHFFP